MSDVERRKRFRPIGFAFLSLAVTFFAIGLTGREYGFAIAPAFLVLAIVFLGRARGRPS